MKRVKNKHKNEMCKDPILNDVCTYNALSIRKYKKPDVYKDVVVENQIINKGD